MKIRTLTIYSIGFVVATTVTACGSSSSPDAIESEAGGESNPSISQPLGDGSLQNPSGSVENPQGNATNSSGSALVDEAPIDELVPLRLDFVGYQLLESLGGYALDLLAERVIVIGELAGSTAISSIELDAGGLDLIDQDEVVSVPVTRTQYQCALGGELLIEKTAAEFWGTSYSRDIEKTTYRFDQCRLSPAAEQLIDGSVAISSDVFFANRSRSDDNTLNWENFSWTQIAGPSVFVHASLSDSDVQEFDSSASRTAIIDRYESSLDGQIIEQINDGRFQLSFSTSEAGDVRGYSLNADGRVIDQSAVPISIVTDPPMRRKLVFGGVNVEPVLFNGQITMAADDGSQLLLEATSTSDTSTLQVNSTYVDSSGNVTSRTNQNFVNLVISAN